MRDVVVAYTKTERQPLPDTNEVIFRCERKIDQSCSSSKAKVVFSGLPDFGFGHEVL